MKTYSAQPLEAVAYFAHDDGTADVYLRRNIGTEEAAAHDGESVAVHCADEVHAVTDKPEEWFSANFDAAWAELERANMSDAERIIDLEAQLDEQASAINELAVIMTGGE